MRPLGVLAPEDAVGPLCDRLVATLAERGRVAVLTRDGVDRGDRPTTYRLSGDGAWSATGEGMGLPDAFETLAPSHEYALVTGFPEAAIPHLVVGDVGYESDPLVTAPGLDAVNLDAVAEALEETEPFETLASLVARVKRAPGADRAGAIATFTGCVRVRDGDDDAQTTHLEFEKYAGIAEQRMAAISDELADRDGVIEVLLHHRSGVIDAGEDIVFVVVLAGHREEAFRTVKDGIDRLKAEVPIFKREVTVEESFWVHERP